MVCHFYFMVQRHPEIQIGFHSRIGYFIGYYSRHHPTYGPAPAFCNVLGVALGSVSRAYSPFYGALFCCLSPLVSKAFYKYPSSYDPFSANFCRYIQQPSSDLQLASNTLCTNRGLFPLRSPPKMAKSENSVGITLLWVSLHILSHL